MKLNELMVGDWVYVDKVKKPIRVESVGYTAFVGYEHFQEIDGSIYGIYPIELTEEILLKNGFKHDAFLEKIVIDRLGESVLNFPVVLISEDNRIILNNIKEYLNSFNKWNIHIDTEDMRTLCGVEITYVHELQHVLTLCGIKKEIVL